MRYTKSLHKGKGKRNRTKKIIHKRRHLEKTRQRRNKKDKSMFKQTLKSVKEIWKKVDDPLQQKKMFVGGVRQELKIEGKIEITDVLGDLLKFLKSVNEYENIDDTNKLVINSTAEYIKVAIKNSLTDNENRDIITNFESILTSNDKSIIANYIKETIKSLIDKNIYSHGYTFEGTLILPDNYEVNQTPVNSNQEGAPLQDKVMEVLAPEKAEVVIQEKTDYDEFINKKNFGNYNVLKNDATNISTTDDKNEKLTIVKEKAAAMFTALSNAIQNNITGYTANTEIIEALNKIIDIDVDNDYNTNIKTLTDNIKIINTSTLNTDLLKEYTDSEENKSIVNNLITRIIDLVETIRTIIQENNTGK